jgi:hypothetical protein
LPFRRIKTHSRVILRSGRGYMGQRHGLIVKGKRISCPPQYGHRDLQGVPRRLRERHGFEHRFPLIRSLRASVQRSTSVLFSFVVSFDCGRIIRHPPIKSDSDAILSSGPTEWQRIGNQINAARSLRGLTS